MKYHKRPYDSIQYYVNDPCENGGLDWVQCDGDYCKDSEGPHEYVIIKSYPKDKDAKYLCMECLDKINETMKLFYKDSSALTLVPDDQ